MERLVSPSEGHEWPDYYWLAYSGPSCTCLPNMGMAAPVEPISGLD